MSTQQSSHSLSFLEHFFQFLTLSDRPFKNLTKLQKKTFAVCFMVLIVAAIGLRFFKLTSIPAGMTWDEVAIGYNGFNVWKAHRDEWLVKMPVSFRSFGDYKAPLAIYVDGLFTTLLGMNILAVRLPFTLLSIGTVLFIPVFVFLILRTIPLRVSPKDSKLALVITMLFSLAFITFSPWHIHFSRAGFESGIALFFLVFATVCELAWLQKKPQSIGSYFFLCVSSVLFVLSMYTYHSAKVVAPLIASVTFVFFSKSRVQHWLQLIIGCFLAAALLSPMLYDSLFLKGAERLQQTTFLTDTRMNVVQKIIVFFQHVVQQFSLNFLIGGGTTTLRHSDGKWGVLYSADLLLIVLGVLIAVHMRKNKHTQRICSFAVCWIVIGLIPTWIGNEIPHPNRALLALPGFVLFESLALYNFLLDFSQLKGTDTFSFHRIFPTKLVSQALIGSFILMYSLLVLSYLNHYFTHFSLESENDFSYGYQQMFEKVLPLEDSVDKILLTSAYGQPYIYTLFFRNTDTFAYHNGALVKYEFKNDITLGDLHRKNTLIVATPKEIDPTYADSLVIAPSGEVRFVIIKTKE